MPRTWCCGFVASPGPELPQSLPRAPLCPAELQKLLHPRPGNPFAPVAGVVGMALEKRFCISVLSLVASAQKQLELRTP